MICRYPLRKKHFKGEVEVLHLFRWFTLARNGHCELVKWNVPYVQNQQSHLEEQDKGSQKSSEWLKVRLRL